MKARTAKVSRQSKVTRLSKSKLMAGLQCPKRLYLSIHDPKLASATDAAKQAMFDQGHAVGIEAQKRYPGGVLVDAPHYSPDKALEQTAAAIEGGACSLYEAAFIHDDVLVRVDILHRDAVGSPWQIIEVKSSTQVKDEHVQDVAIQNWVVRGAGLDVVKSSVMHINTQFIHPHDGDLFTTVDVTEQLEDASKKIPKLLKSLRTYLAKPKAPSQDIGSHCSDPYDCEFREHCWREKKVPDLSIFDLPNLSSKRKWELYEDGIVALTDKHLKSVGLNVTQQRVIEIGHSDKRYIQPKAIANELRSWDYPHHYLDFETFNPALPRYEGTRPYQQLPFQFSCHMQASPGADLAHAEYLHEEDTDPRPSLAAALVKSIGSKGAVIAYNKSFEARCLEDLTEAVPKLSAKLLSIRDRLVDPLPTVRANVYDRKFHGSFSIKYVAPALLGESMSYKGMVVSDGSEAQAAYERLISGALEAAERERLKTGMLEYCRKDTLAMVKLVEWLFLQITK